MIISNFGIWNFDNLIFLDIENINFWIYMYVILVGQALVFLRDGGGGGGGGEVGAEPSLPETKNELHLGLNFVGRKSSMYLYSIYSTG